MEPLVRRRETDRVAIGGSKLGQHSSPSGHIGRPHAQRHGREIDAHDHVGTSGGRTR